MNLISCKDSSSRVSSDMFMGSPWIRQGTKLLFSGEFGGVGATRMRCVSSRRLHISSFLRTFSNWSTMCGILLT